MAYSDSPVRKSVRVNVTSVNSIGSRPAVLSMVRDTSARPSAGRFAVPAKITSSIFWLRTALGACAPSTQAMASTTLDLPLPLGPTTTVTPGSRVIVVGSAKDLKPLSVSDRRNTAEGDRNRRVRRARGGRAARGAAQNRRQRGARWQRGHTKLDRPA